MTANSSPAEQMDARVTYCQSLPKWKPKGEDAGVCRCELPGHQDDSPSFYVGYRTPEGIGHCLGCNWKGTMVEYCKLTGKKASPFYVPGRQSAQQEQTQYIYHAPDGTQLLRVTRRPGDGHKKTFFQQRWEAGGWVKGGLNPAPLYAAKQLADAHTGTLVFLVEGEKCAEHMLGRGLLATTGPEGAGKFQKVGREYLDLLLPLGPVILPDNDPPGHQHALQVAERLQRELDIEAKILLLPGLAVKGDVADWLQVPLTKRNLLDLVPSALTVAQYRSWLRDSGGKDSPGLEPIGDDLGPNLWEDEPVLYTRPISSPANEPLPSGWIAPEPFQVRDDDLVVAPLWVLPESLRHMVDTVADAKQVTPGAVLGSLLGLLSAICGGRYTANLASQYETHAHIWILLALRSAGGKSEALKVLAKPVFRAQKRLQHETQEQNDRHTSERANLFKQIAAMESGSPEEYPGQLSEARGRLKDVATKPLPRFLWKDVSPQKLDILYARHQRVGIVSPESADWISLVMGYGKDQGPTLGSCLSGFSVEAHGSDRVTREESHCERPVLTLFLACQEKDVKDFIGDPVARRRGFLGRTLVFRGQSLVGKRLSYDRRPSIAPEDVLPWNALVEVVTSQIPGSDDDGWVPLSVPVTNEGRELFCRLFDVVEKRLSEYSPDLRLDELEDIAGRSLEQVGRLAILLHVLWTAPRRIQPTAEPISEATVFRAFTLMLWALQGFMDLSAPGAEGAHNAAMGLWKDLDASALCATGTCTVKDWVRSGPNRWRSSSKLESQLSILEALGYIQLVSKRNVRGPASKVIELNPRARGVFLETVATVATVFENPLFIEVITAQPHLRRFATVATVSEDRNTVEDPPEGIRQNGTCDGISTAGKASCQTVATVAGNARQLTDEVHAIGNLF